MKVFALLLVGLCLVAPVLTQKNEKPFDDYGDVDSPGAGAKGADLGPDGASDLGDKPAEEGDEEGQGTRTKFSDERFAKLFPSRGRGPAVRSLMPYEVKKAKPTLPPFIKSTPPLLKVSITTPAPSRVNRRASTPAPVRSGKSTTTTTTPRPRSRTNPLSGRTNQQLIGRLGNTSSRPSLSSTTTIAPRRRTNPNLSRFQRPNANSTIPALNPRRN